MLNKIIKLVQKDAPRQGICLLFFIIIILTPTSTSAVLTVNPNEIENIKAAAEAGDSSAQYTLGILYYKGQILEKDISEGIRWFERAAEQNEPRAAYTLGAVLYNGQDVKQDKKEGLKWLNVAAKFGNQNAKYFLSEIGESPKATNLEATKPKKTPQSLTSATSKPVVTPQVPKATETLTDYRAIVQKYRNPPRQRKIDIDRTELDEARDGVLVAFDYAEISKKGHITKDPPIDYKINQNKITNQGGYRTRMDLFVVVKPQITVEQIISLLYHFDAERDLICQRERIPIFDIYVYTKPQFSNMESWNRYAGMTDEILSVAQQKAIAPVGIYQYNPNMRASRKFCFDFDDEMTTIWRNEDGSEWK